MANAQVPQGNTVQGVNKSILDFLKLRTPQLSSLFDVPCGQGEFLSAVRNSFPQAFVWGQDLYATPIESIKDRVARGDAKDWTSAGARKFQAITCISGVMAFDDLTGFFAHASSHLEKGGFFIVTNDNVMSLRDRLHFLFFGRVKRFQLLYSKTEGNWNLVLPQAIWKLAVNNGFRLEKVEYLTPKIEDWLLAPIGLIFYLFQIFPLLKSSDISSQEKKMLFPPQMMWMRHMIFYFKKL